MISTFLDAYRGKDTTTLRWLKKLSNCNRLVRVLRTPWYRGIFILSRSWRLQTTLPIFLSARLLPTNLSEAMKSKRKSTRLLVEEGFLLRRGFNQAPLKCTTRMKWPEFSKNFFWILWRASKEDPSLKENHSFGLLAHHRSWCYFLCLYTQSILNQ